MVADNKVLFAKTGDDLSEGICLLPKMANRHGFVCGATGTGKTVALKVLAESFSAMGVPVFLADVKGDIAGMIKPGVDSENMQERIAKFGIADSFTYQSYPTQFFDIFGEKGIPLRTTVSEMGPQLMAQVLELNDTQSDVLSVVYKVADDEKLVLSDTKDLKAMLQYVSENAAEYELEYGRIAKASLTTIVRKIVAIEEEGADQFFGEPAVAVTDFFTNDISGKGMITILDSETLINKPRLYSAFMMYLLSELFEVLPEVGDPEKPRIVFFFDEAHLLFSSASKTLMQKIEQMIKLIRSKGVGVYFVTQSPADIPDGVMSQLGNKIEHALRAYTPKEMKAVKTAASAFRANPDFDTAELMQSLATGEAIVSMLDEKGTPGIAQHAYIMPPESYMGGITDEERQQSIKSSNLYLKYNTPVDPDSAYEFLMRLKQKMTDEAAAAKEEAEKAKAEAKAQAEAEKQAAKEAAAAEKQAAKEAAAAEKQAAKEAAAAEKAALKEKQAKEKAVKSGINSVGKTVTGTIGRQVGGTIGKTVGGTFGKTLGSNLGGSLGRNLFGTLFKG